MSPEQIALWRLQSSRGELGARTTPERLDELQDALDGAQAALAELRREATPDRAELLTLRLRAMAERARELAHALIA
jgi:hypothetical protein